MKKIIFVRHGKAEDESHGISDFERSLTTAGKRITAKIAELFYKQEKIPGIFISSPAFRALETALIFAGASGKGYDYVCINSDLYFRTNSEKLMGILSGLDEEADSVIFFGHNPSFSEMADAFSRDGCDFVPKSGVAGISFDVRSWKEIKPKTGKLEYFLKPEKLI